MFRRIIYIFMFPVVGLILLCLTAWGYIVTHQQQIDNYLSAQFSYQLGTPVSLQNATLGFHPAPTIDFENVRIRDAEKKLHLTIPQLHIGMAWQDLLNGDLVITKLIMVRPDIYWQPASNTALGKTLIIPTAQPQPQQCSAQKATTLLRKAKIINATVHLITTRKPDTVATTSQITPATTTWELHQLNASLSSYTCDQIQITLSGKLRQPSLHDANITFSTRLKDARSDWLDAPIQAQLNLKNISGANLSRLALPLSCQLSGTYDLQLDIAGKNPAGLHLSSQITPRQHHQTITLGNNRPVQFNALSIDTTLRWDAQQLQLQPLKLTHDKLAITASVQIDNWHKTQSAAAHIHIQLNSSPIKLAKLLDLVPPALRAKLPQGAAQTQLQCQKLVVDGPLNALNSNAIKQAQFTIKHPDFNYLGIHAPQLVASINYTDHHGSITTSPITLTMDKLQLDGPLTIKIGDLNNDTYKLSADLSPMAIQATTLIHKAAGEAGQLNFELHHQDDTNGLNNHKGRIGHNEPIGQWSVVNGEVAIPGYKVLFNGNYTAPNSYHAELQLPNYDLETISAKIPLLKQMQLHGKIAARYQLDKTASQPLNSSGQIILQDCAISPTYVIAPINHINGQVEIDNFGLQAKNIALNLGSSPMQINAHIADLRHPVAQLHITGDNIIADDLVFNNQDILLKNLDGRIDIHRHGIDFIAVTVKLPQGTVATVKGKLHFKPIALALNIDAPYADINEVIALWHHSSDLSAANKSGYHNQLNFKPKDKKPLKQASPQEFIHIHTHVAQGILSGLKFQHARAEIHYRHGQLRIEPLRFAAGTGSTSGSVLLINQTQQTAHTPPSLIKIAGVINNINADKVYRQLLRRNGIVTGKLNGDFFIQGPIGSSFLANSNGNVHLNIQRGVLREFKFISKAFSLLNVAQLFALNLPDMATQGMPFTQLTGDINLTNGTLHTENLNIKSAAMGLSLIGEHNLVTNQLDLIMDIKPLGTVDSVVNNIPIAGWVLAGGKKNLISSNFRIRGPATDPSVSMMPLTTVANKLFGILKRTIKLPVTLFNNPIKILTNNSD